MAKALTSLDDWREYFSGADSDIFDLIKHAITVAASDYPLEFRVNRDGIAELLFSCKLTKCCGCGRTEWALPTSDDSVEANCDKKYKFDTHSCGIKDAKMRKADSRDDYVDIDNQMRKADRKEANVDRICDQSYKDLEALSDEMEEEMKMVEEVLRIKGIIDNSEAESDKGLLELLRRLQLMHVSVEILTNTRIGKSVNTLRKHGSKDVSNLARALIVNWRNMFDAWVHSTAAVADADLTKESAKMTPASAEEEVGLPSPPMDEGDLLATPASMELSKIFDGFDDDGNIQNGVELNMCEENIRKWSPIYSSSPKRVIQKSQFTRPNRSPSSLQGPGKKSNPGETAMPKRPNYLTTPQKCWLKKDSVFCKVNRPPNGTPAFPKPKPVARPMIKDELNVHQRNVKGTTPRKPPSHPKEKSDPNNEPSFGMKLELAKRKLQERYQEVEIAKKQRTIQVVELSDLPKQIISRGIRQ